ncbi:MAG: GIY-YIG nuclease family protein [Longimicrobiaceae bacterium]
MSSDKRYYVYILSNASRTLYIGVTNDLARRVREHKNKVVPGFTAKYNVTQLVYFEETPHPQAAIAREKELKRWNRAKKVKLVASANPTWRDLAADEGSRPF